MAGWWWIAVGCSGDPADDGEPPVESETATDTGSPTTTTDTGDCVDGFADSDGDGFGDPARPVGCEDPTAVPAGTDCDDADPDVHPGADERCDGLDGDCDPSTGEDGLVTLIDAYGITVDLTPEFTAGTAQDPQGVALASGRYDLCAGTYYVRLQGAGTTTEIDGGGVAVVDAGRSGSAIALVGGTVTLTDLTVTGGRASVQAPTGIGLSGGGLACIDVALTVTGATFVGNEAEIGGGWFVDGCTVTATGTTLTENAATYGGGLYLVDGDVSLTASTVSANEAASSGGGLGVEGVGPRPRLTLTDTVVADNVALFGGGLVTYENAEAICVGGPGVAGGFFRNRADLGGGLYITGADYPPQFTADGCDFGVGADDNVPTDVVTAYAAQLPFAYGDDASFVCDTNGCL